MKIKKIDVASQSLVLFMNRGKMALVAGICLLLVALSIGAFFFLGDAIAKLKDWSGRLYFLCYGGIGMAFLAGVLGLTWNLPKALFPPRALVVSSSQIELFRYGAIRWTEIERLVVRRRFGQHLLGVFPKDLDKIKSQLNRLTIERNISNGLPPIYVMQTILPIAIDDVIEEIGRFTDIAITEEKARGKIP